MDSVILPKKRSEYGVIYCIPHFSTEYPQEFLVFHKAEMPTRCPKSHHYPPRGIETKATHIHTEIYSTMDQRYMGSLLSAK